MNLYKNLVNLTEKAEVCCTGFTCILRGQKISIYVQFEKSESLGKCELGGNHMKDATT